MNTPFLVDKIKVYPQLNRIKFETHTVSIEPRLMKLLVYMAEKNGELCSREELIAHVWGGDFVNKNALTRAMSDLRKAFNDSSGTPMYFETIPKQGYRFLVPIKKLEPKVDKPKPASYRNYWRSAGVVILLFAMSIAYVSLTTPKVTYGNKVIKKSIPIIVRDSTNLPDSAFHRKVEAIVDAEVTKEMRED